LLLAWAFGPIVSAYFWWRSMPAHYEWLTLGLAVLFVLALYAMLTSGWSAWAEMAAKPYRKSKWGINVLAWILVLVLPLISWIRTENDFGTGLLSRANLAGAYLTKMPADWLPHDHARKWFFAKWCGREELGSTCQGISQDQIDERQQEWRTSRQIYLDNLPGPDFRNRDFRGADLSGTFLANLNLQGASMQEANLEKAQMQRANLYKAEMQGANLKKATLQRSDLRWAQMQRANLSFAKMQRTNFSNAEMREANLSRAEMQEANLNGTEMKGAIIVETQLQGAELVSAKLQGAELIGAQMQEADLRWAQMQRAELNRAHLQGADLRGAQIQEANLSWTEMQGALLTGSEEEPSSLQSTSFKGSDTSLLAIKHVNFSGAKDISQQQINQMFGDTTVIIPDGLHRPCHWAKQDLEFEDWVPETNNSFVAHWRGWVEANGGSWPTSPQFVELFKDVTPIPPPPECPLIKDM
jgi:uncharacterized protein YjbI with pentapeptide repeats